MLCEPYKADSGRGTGLERVFCVRLSTPSDLLMPGPSNRVLFELHQAGIDKALGVYSYRFTSAGSPFLKIGE